MGNIIIYTKTSLFYINIPQLLPGISLQQQNENPYSVLCYAFGVKPALRAGFCSGFAVTAAYLPPYPSRGMHFLFKNKNGIPIGIRTRVAGMKTRCPRPLDDRDATCYIS